jgi:hypothetical protein
MIPGGDGYEIRIWVCDSPDYKTERFRSPTGAGLRFNKRIAQLGLDHMNREHNHVVEVELRKGGRVEARRISTCIHLVDKEHELEHDHESIDVHHPHRDDADRPGVSSPVEERA